MNKLQVNSILVKMSIYFDQWVQLKIFLFLTFPNSLKIYLQNRHNKNHQPPINHLNNFMSLNFLSQLFHPLDLSSPDMNACSSLRVHDI